MSSASSQQLLLRTLDPLLSHCYTPFSVTLRQSWTNPPEISLDWQTAGGVIQLDLMSCK